MTTIDVVRSMNRGKSSTDRLAEGERILSDRVSGMRQAELMEKYQLSRATLSRRVAEAINARLSVTVDQHRELQDALLDDLMARRREGLTAADVLIQDGIAREDMALVRDGLIARDRALDGMLRTAERRARLHGLDAPVKVEAEVVQVTQQEKELADMLAAAEAEQKARETSIVEGDVVA